MAKHIVRPHKDFAVDMGEGVKLEMIWIPGGIFMMGQVGLEWEEPVHEVELDGFWMGKYPVTQAQSLREYPQYHTDREISDLDCYFEGLDLPVENETSYGADGFCGYLSEITGQKFCLPTEAQWEYACRGGTQTAYYFGDDPKLLDDYAWHRENSDGETHPVGLKKPNPFGLYDMYGNVWEWCRDQFEDTFYQISPRKNPENKHRCNGDVLRGGSWCSLPHACRSAFRYRQEMFMNNTGFRVTALDEKYEKDED